MVGGVLDAFAADPGRWMEVGSAAFVVVGRLREGVARQHIE